MLRLVAPWLCGAMLIVIATLAIQNRVLRGSVDNLTNGIVETKVKLDAANLTIDDLREKFDRQNAGIDAHAEAGERAREATRQRIEAITSNTLPMTVAKALKAPPKGESLKERIEDVDARFLRSLSK